MRADDETVVSHPERERAAGKIISEDEERNMSEDDVKL